MPGWVRGLTADPQGQRPERRPAATRALPEHVPSARVIGALRKRIYCLHPRIGENGLPPNAGCLLFSSGFRLWCPCSARRSAVVLSPRFPVSGPCFQVRNFFVLFLRPKMTGNIPVNLSPTASSGANFRLLQVDSQSGFPPFSYFTFSLYFCSSVIYTFSVLPSWRFNFQSTFFGVFERRGLSPQGACTSGRKCIFPRAPFACSPRL